MSDIIFNFSSDNQIQCRQEETYLLICSLYSDLLILFGFNFYSKPLKSLNVFSIT